MRERNIGRAWREIDRHTTETKRGGGVRERQRERDNERERDRGNEREEE